MILNNKERVGKALELLEDGLGPFVERQLMNAYGEEAHSRAGQFRGPEHRLANTPVTQWDAYPLLKLMKETWHDVFRNVLSPEDRNLVHELYGQRNKWAHQKSSSFSSGDAYRALDSVSRLLGAIAAPQASEAENMKAELGRLIYAQPVRSEKYKAGGKEYPCPIPGCQKVFSGSRGGWDAHIASLEKHPKWHPEIDDPYDRKARFKTEFSGWFTRG